MLGLFFIILILLILIIYCIYKKQTKNNLDKVLAMILGSIMIAILIIYFLDKYNIPTALGIGNNTNTKEWFDFIMNFLVTMLGTFISAILILATTIGQLKRTEDNEKENQRINNMPFLEYKVNIINNTLNLKLKNIGNNTIKKYFIKIKDKNILSDYQNCLAVNEESKITYKLPLDKNQIQITIEYQDLLYNIYEQEINITYIVNNKKISINEVIIKDEKLRERKRS